jgi:hypothetical protein
MAFKNPFNRESRVASNLSNMTPYRDCVDQTYGDEEDDYSPNELKASDNDVYNYYETLETNTVTIKEQSPDAKP